MVCFLGLFVWWFAPIGCFAGGFVGCLVLTAYAWLPFAELIVAVLLGVYVLVNFGVILWVRFIACGSVA